MSRIVMSGPENPVELQVAVEQELEAFNRWFTSPLSSGGGGNAPLILPERALLRTFLVARLSGRMPSPQEEKETSPA